MNRGESALPGVEETDWTLEQLGSELKNTADSVTCQQTLILRRRKVLVPSCAHSLTRLYINVTEREKHTCHGGDSVFRLVVCPVRLLPVTAGTGCRCLILHHTFLLAGSSSALEETLFSLSLSLSLDNLAHPFLALFGQDSLLYLILCSGLFCPGRPSSSRLLVSLHVSVC